jgi:hypothetical protein
MIGVDNFLSPPNAAQLRAVSSRVDAKQCVKLIDRADARRRDTPE